MRNRACVSSVSDGYLRRRKPVSDQIRVGDQSEDRQGDWADYPRIRRLARRPGDQIRRQWKRVANSNTCNSCFERESGPGHSRRINDTAGMSARLQIAAVLLRRSELALRAKTCRERVQQKPGPHPSFSREVDVTFAQAATGRCRVSDHCDAQRICRRRAKSLFNQRAVSPRTVGAEPWG